MIGVAPAGRPYIDHSNPALAAWEAAKVFKYNKESHWNLLHTSPVECDFYQPNGYLRRIL
eukprot:1006981-Amphidinium_carterae.1